ncbi:hypothetical protein PMW_84 [Pseudomonas phage phiPMW]|uniref:Uncharacterized protein n=1 Tax=Pseudomonas phage phiPMW TaxID=1815582 RepID=A0A1S5R1E5_9CAUD|nr:hypothetical protein FDG97_gp084 [Pseudomonas phage phiPMW]ANA49209.1 hypothetical protein PMW_84 [Pseudomonas phage phiPMW]
MSITELNKPEGQDRKVFNQFKKALEHLPDFTNEQLARLQFEVFHEARMRTDHAQG